MKLEFFDPKTQKAKSIKKLQALYSSHEWRDILIFNSANGVSEQEEAKLKSKYISNRMIRPCPLKPRHGFVESVELGENINNLNRVLKETFEEDKDAEVILMRNLGTTASAVVTKNMITIANKNDGVTSGKEKATNISFNLYDFPLYSISDYINSSYYNFGLECDDGYALELVTDEKRNWNCVQVRALPKDFNIPLTENIPCDMTITRIIDGNLMLPMEAEKVIPELCKNPGAIVYVNSLQSHVATHVLLNHMAISTIMYKKGDKIKKTPPDKINTVPTPKQLKQFSLILRSTLSNSINQLVNVKPKIVELQALYNIRGLSTRMSKVCTRWKLDTEMNMRILALSIYAMFVYSVTASIGEARHYYSRTRSGTGYKGALHKIFKKQADHTYYLVRNDILNEAEKLKLHNLLGMMEVANKIFSLVWCDGYGGKKWKRITLGAQELYDSLRDFNSSPNLHNYEKICSKYTTLSSLTHNGGTGALSKFLYNINALVCLVDTAYTLSQTSLKAIKESKYLPKPRKIKPFKRLNVNRNWSKIPACDDSISRILLTNYKSKYIVKWVTLLKSVPDNYKNTPIGLVISGEFRVKERPHSNIPRNIPIVVNLSINKKGLQITDNKLYGWHYDHSFFESVKNIIAIPRTDYSRALCSGIIKLDGKVYSTFSLSLLYTHKGIFNKILGTILDGGY